MKDYLLDREEWDFRPIPADEIDSTSLYELARTAVSWVGRKEVFPDYPLDTPPRTLNRDSKEDLVFWYHNTIGWYLDWTGNPELLTHKAPPWIGLSDERKSQYIITKVEQIPAHLTSDFDLSLPYTKSLTHLEYNPEPNSLILRRRLKYIKS